VECVFLYRFYVCPNVCVSNCMAEQSVSTPVMVLLRKEARNIKVECRKNKLVLFLKENTFSCIYNFQINVYSISDYLNIFRFIYSLFMSSFLYDNTLCAMKIPNWNLKLTWTLSFIGIRQSIKQKPSFNKRCMLLYTGCNRRNGPDFGRVFLMSNYTEKPQNTYIQSWTVWEIMASEIWNFDSCYTLTDYQIRIETGRNMWFL